MKIGKHHILPLLLLFLAGCSGTNPAPSVGNNLAPSVGTNPAPTVQDQPKIPGPNGLPAFTLTDAYPNLSFDQPLEYVPAGDGSNRVFVVQRTGKIYVFNNDPQVTNANIFLDLSNLLDTSYIEKGLLGLAFHPNFAQNGFFYVDYTNRSNQTIIARYQVNPDNPDQGLINSAEVLLTIAQPYKNHKGGHLAFGPDGYLYIGMGDGGSAGDPQGNGQNLGTLLGKILRIDVDQTSAGKKYGIPADNPWAGNQDGYREEIYSYGFRNPWKFSFDKKSGRLWVADVGQDTVEEIDIVEKGLNYGWNIMEGSLCYPASTSCTRAGLQLPIWEYQHPLGISITGGYVYYGSQTPSLYGAYMYGDYGKGQIWALWVDATGVPHNYLVLATTLNISSFGLDKNNELFIIDLNGKIYKLKEVI
jgi:glucose/arabinose dehydrogenase